MKSRAIPNSKQIRFDSEADFLNAVEKMIDSRYYVCYESKESFENAVSKEFDRYYQTVVNDSMPQWIALVIWTLMIEYNHRASWCIKLAENIIHTSKMVNKGYGTDNPLTMVDVLEALKERGVDVAEIYQKIEVDVDGQNDS